MKELLAPFYEVIENRHEWIKRYKEQSGKKIAGYFCDYTPEEFLWAAGFTPVRITGGRGLVGEADKHLQSNVCSFARRCFDQALTGVYSYLDAVIIPHTCDVITKMYDLWAYRMKTPDFLHYVWTPHKVFDKSAPAVFEGELKRLKKCLEGFIGSEIKDEALADATSLYDKSRTLLKRVYELRRSDPPMLSGTDAFAVSLSSMLAPKDIHNEWMEKLLEETHKVQSSALERRPRVLISASVLDDLELVKATEDAGMLVVADDVCTGSRYFWDVVGESVSNPIKALTMRYLNKLPCPRSVGSLQRRSDHIFNLINDYKISGVIFYILRCCDAHLFQYPILNERLQQKGINTLYIQGDQTVGVNESVINRLSAFGEILSS